MLAAAGVGHLAGQLLLVTHPESWVFDEGDFYGQGFYMGAMYAITVALALALWFWLGRRLQAAYLAVAALGWLAVLAAFYAIVSPTVSFLLTWPALLGLLAPQLALVTRAIRRRWLPAAATLLMALIGVGLLLAGNAASGYDAAHPQPDTLFYALNADTGEANWATLDPEQD